MKTELFYDDLKKEDFIQIYGNDGYIEDWSGYQATNEKYTTDDIVNKCLVPFYNKEKISMELGTGGGYWVKNFLSPNFKKVICLDVIPQPTHFGNNIEYVELNSKDFYLTGVEDNSVDFVWSFGMFCHLSNAAAEIYLNSLYKKVKPNGKCVVMFPDWPKNPHMKLIDNGEQYKNKCYKKIYWYYYDSNTIKNIMLKSKFINFKDLIPDFRDFIAYFEK